MMVILGFLTLFVDNLRQYTRFSSYFEFLIVEYFFREAVAVDFLDEMSDRASCGVM